MVPSFSYTSGNMCILAVLRSFDLLVESFSRPLYLATVLWLARLHLSFEIGKKFRHKADLLARSEVDQTLILWRVRIADVVGGVTKPRIISCSL